MNLHALRVLEFSQTLEAVAERAQSGLGRERVRSLVPTADLERVQAELLRVEELASFLDRNPHWRIPPVPDARAGLRRLEKEGSVLEGGELHSLGLLLTAGRELDGALALAGDGLRSLGFVRQGLYRDRAAEKRIQLTVDDTGAVLDSASPQLAAIRERLRWAHGRIVRALERLLASLPERYVVPDASVTIREGRYVIPIRREGRGEVGGVVLDESATGATLFVEPPVAQALMGELRDLEREEAREIHRILREQTEALRPVLPLLQASQEALVTFDALYARARMALAWGGHAPELLPPGAQELVVVQGRHPLLVVLGGVDSVVPFDLSLEPGERALVVSGPNTGGKSVFLKALGLVVLLAQAGVVPPVGRGTRLPVFRGVYADIGDEQSIADNLSTFSAHVAHLKEILQEAGPDSLVLVDELGSGTDPREGAALARVFLEELVERGALTVVTSHLGALKELDRPGSGVVNASLQFDPERLAPTFRLVKGRPGRSYGLAIARRLGFPARLLDRAQAYLPQEELRLEDLLRALESKEKEVSRQLEDLHRRQAEVEALLRDLEAREQALRAREREAELRAKQAARQFLLEARREVEAVIEELRRAAAAGGGEEAPGTSSLPDLARQARRKVEEAARRTRGPLANPRRSRVGLLPLPGEVVGVVGSKIRGRLVEVREGRAVVESGGVRIQVPVEDVVAAGGVEGEEGERAARQGREEASSWVGPEVDASPELDLRGLRAAEVDGLLDRALDRAVLGGLGELRVIHGKGTGALRERVASLLSQDPRVKDFRIGLPGEGGTGVTVVRLR